MIYLFAIIIGGVTGGLIVVGISRLLTPKLKVDTDESIRESEERERVLEKREFYGKQFDKLLKDFKK